MGDAPDPPVGAMTGDRPVPASAPSTGAERVRTDVLDVAAVAAVALVPVVAGPMFAYPETSPKYALGLVLAAAGLVALAMGLRRRVPAYLAAAALVGVTVVSALASGQWRVSLVGDLSSPWAPPMVVVVLGCWALGRTTRVSADLLGSAFLGAAALNALFAVAQGYLLFPTTVLGRLADDRAYGLTANPVQLGALAVGAAALLAWRAAEGRAVAAHVASLGLAGLVLGLSGSRVAALAAVVATAVAMRRRAPLALLGVAAVVAGILLAGATTTTSVSGRLSGSGGSSSSITPRLGTWRYGLDAWTERPVLGWGPDRFARATSGRVTAAVARTEEPGSRFWHAHNLVVEALTTTGVLGLAALAAWLALAGRGTAGPLLVAALAMGTSLLVEPPDLGWLTVAACFLGAAARHREVDRRRVRAVVALPFLLAAAVLAGAVAAGDMAIARAVRRHDFDAARRATTLLPWSMETHRVRAGLLVTRARATGRTADRAAARAVVADGLRLDPSDPTMWLYESDLALDAGHPREALADLQRVRAVLPWSPAILKRIHDVALRVGDERAARDAARDRCAAAPDASGCP